MMILEFFYVFWKWVFDKNGVVNLWLILFVF